MNTTPDPEPIDPPVAVLGMAGMEPTPAAPVAEQEQFTPGPWDDASHNDDSSTVRIFAKCHYIGSIGNSDDPPEQTRANARLIASAPAMHARLAAVRALCGEFKDNEWCGVFANRILAVLEEGR